MQLLRYTQPSWALLSFVYPCFFGLRCTCKLRIRRSSSPLRPFIDLYPRASAHPCKCQVIHKADMAQISTTVYVLAVPFPAQALNWAPHALASCLFQRPIWFSSGDHNEEKLSVCVHLSAPHYLATRAVKFRVCSRESSRPQLGWEIIEIITGPLSWNNKVTVLSKLCAVCIIATDGFFSLTCLSRLVICEFLDMDFDKQ